MARKSKEADKAYAKAWRERPENAAREKERARRNWEDPEYRARQTERQKERMKDPERLARQRQQQKEWAIKNKERMRELQAAWRKENKQRVLELARLHHSKPETKAKAAERHKRRRSTEEFKDKRRKQIAQRRRSDPNYQIEMALRTRVYAALRSSGVRKNTRTATLIGCAVGFLREYLQSQFSDGMTWDNYGPKGWHIDHKRPCSSFDLTDTAQQKVCFHYTNLQPMWWIDNLRKSDKIIDFPRVA